MLKEKSYDLFSLSTAGLFFMQLVLLCTSCEREQLEILIPAEVVHEEALDTCFFEYYMPLVSVAAEAQGSACFGDYFVQGYNFNNCLSIYNLREKKYLETIPIPAPAPSVLTHVNTVNFGSQRLCENDYFPLLYISSGYPTNGISFVYVYRILREVQGDKEEFSISLVQTISLLDFGKWTEGIVDGQTNSIWVKYEPIDKYGYAMYNLPLVSEGDSMIYYDGFIENFQLDRTLLGSRNQGHMYKDGKIILVSGIPSIQERLAFISIDVKKGEVDYIIDLAELGLINPDNPLDNSFEPEGVIVFDGSLMICYRKALYKFNVGNIYDNSNSIVDM